MTRFFTVMLTLVVTHAWGVVQEKEVDGVTYYWVEAPPASVRVVWKDDNNTALRTFPVASQYLQSKGLDVAMLMNGGIFEPRGVPSGLLIQDGRELCSVNRNSGKGNFYLQPNGIFLLGPSGAQVINTDEYPVLGMRVQYAVQSGPLLLRRGVTHPAFNRHSTNRLHRNGVGVNEKGHVVLAITQFHSPKHPNLFEFAEFFRTMGCQDALFLDGDISELRRSHELDRAGNHFGSFIVVLTPSHAK
jgi:uncharacterized protein YigE (DUF2233 family)